MMKTIGLVALLAAVVAAMCLPSVARAQAPTPNVDALFAQHPYRAIAILEDIATNPQKLALRNKLVQFEAAEMAACVRLDRIAMGYAETDPFVTDVTAEQFAFTPTAQKTRELFIKHYRAIRPYLVNGLSQEQRAEFLVQARRAIRYYGLTAQQDALFEIGCNSEDLHGRLDAEISYNTGPLASQ